MTPASDKLFELLPAFYRAADAREGGALEDLLAVLQDVLDTLEEDTRALYENWFIETCAEWVVPYIGELLGTQPLYTPGDKVLTARAYVAHTLSYRRRKGTAVALQQLASDVTEWPACAVEFFRLLATTQHLNHLRPGNVVRPDLRDSAKLDRVGSTFDTLPRTADVRSIGSPPLARSSSSAGAPTAGSIAGARRGRYNLPNLGLFLWRLAGYPLTEVMPCPVTDGTDGRYRFNVLGLDAPLFNRAQPLAAFSQLAGEVNVPGPLRRRALFDELEARRQAMVDGRQVWMPATPFSVGATVVDNNGNTERALSAGTTGTTVPAWPTERLDEVTDGTVLWQMSAPGSTLPAAYLDAEPVFAVALAPGAVPIAPEQIMICDLSDLAAPAAPGTWRTPAAEVTYTRAGDNAAIALPIRALVDPLLGRLAFAGATMPDPGGVRVSYSYGFSGDLGGGPYNRADSVQPLLAGKSPWQVAVSLRLAPEGGLIFKSLAEAVAAWNGLPPAAERFGVITLLGSDTLHESLTGTAGIQVPGGSTLLIAAAGWPALAGARPPASLGLSPNGQRPLLEGDLEVTGLAPPAGISPGALMLNGLLVAGKLTVLPGDLGSLEVVHCTLVPARGGLQVNAAAGQTNNNLCVSLRRSICGPVQMAEGVPGLTLSDSIVDALAAAAPALAAPSADAVLSRSTVLGTVGSAVGSTVGAGVRSLEATDSLFTGTVWAERVQAGCLRFCSLPSSPSHVPRRYRCQPDLALAGVTDATLRAALGLRLKPVFTSTTYGDAGYAQLSQSCAPELRTGAEDGSEIGAFCFLQQPQRDTNLRSVLLEYLRFGMQGGIFYVT